MSNDLPPVAGVRTGNKVEVRNVGVARIQGTQLLASGYNINWLYYIIDIGAIATYENQSRDVWLGADGIPVAGNTAVLATLPPPIEGQRYYNIQTNQPLQFKGGAWGGASWAAFQVLAPTTVVVTDTTQLTPGRDYLVNCDGKDLTLPSSTVAGDGHIVRLYVIVGSNTNKAVAGAGTTITTLDITGQANVTLLQSQVYEFIYLGGVWYSFTESATLYLRAENNLGDLTDKEEARQNLEVLSAAQTQALAQSIEAAPGGGLLSTGIVGDGDEPRQFAVDFATEAEVLAGAAANKTVSPATLQATVDEKVDAALQASKYNVVTGITAGGASFNLFQSGPSQITWTSAPFVINADPTFLSTDAVFGNIQAGIATVPNVAGYTVQYVSCNNLGVVSFSTNPAINPLLLRLAVLLCKDGLLVATLLCPQLATSDYYLRGLNPTITGGTPSPVAGTSGTLQTSLAVLHEESANWAVQVPDIHYLQQPVLNPASWAYYRNATTELSTGNTVVDGRLYSDGSTVPAANFTIQNVLRDIWGRYYIVAGRTQFTTMALAVAGLSGATPLVPSFLEGVSKEVARIILKGDQYTGNAALNLNDTAKCQIFDAAALGGGAGSSGSASQDFRVVTTAGELQYGNTYILKHNVISGLPAIAADGAWIKVKAYKGFRPLVQRKTVGEVIVDDVTLREDTDLQLDSYEDFITLYIENGKWRY